MIKIDFIAKISPEAGLNKTEIGDILNKSFSELGKTEVFCLEIWFAENETVQQLNRKYRNINKPTDILSFPQNELAGSGKKLLGSLVVSSKMVREKQEAMSDVLKHGLLHLLGYDHEASEEEWGRAAEMIGCEL